MLANAPIPPMYHIRQFSHEEDIKQVRDAVIRSGKKPEQVRTTSQSIAGTAARRKAKKVRLATQFFSYNAVPVVG